MASRSRSLKRFPRADRPTGNPRPRYRPSLLVLEPRILLSTYIVQNTNDGGSGSLRYELGLAGNGDAVEFSPAVFSTGQPQTIV